ncbi:MAG: hypothetical protein ABL940_10090 [Bacteroidia bacterium]
MRTTATVISYLLHPLLMAFYSIAMLFSMQTYLTTMLPGKYQAFLLGFIFLTTCALPALCIGFMLKYKIVSNMDITNYNERRIPYLITAMAYAFNYYLVQKFHLPTLIYYVLLGATLTILLAMCINIVWKISAHSIGIGGLAGLLVGICLRMGLYMPMYITIALLLCGIAASARLVLQVHTPAQVYVGLLLGFGVQFFIIQI